MLLLVNVCPVALSSLGLHFHTGNVSRGDRRLIDCCFDHSGRHSKPPHFERYPTHHIGTPFANRQQLEHRQQLVP